MDCRATEDPPEQTCVQSLRDQSEARSDRRGTWEGRGDEDGPTVVDRGETGRSERET